MKPFILIMCFVGFLACGLSAQTRDTIGKLPPLKHEDTVFRVGRQGVWRAKVSGYRIVNKHLKLLYIGGKYPNQWLIVVIKGNRIILKPSDLMNHGIAVAGYTILYHSKPAIAVTDPSKIGIDDFQ